MILKGPNDITLEYSLKFDFKEINNQVKHEALMANLQLANKVEVRTLSIRSDSQLIIVQMKQEYEVKEQLLTKYVQATQKLLKVFNYKLERISREENSQVDALTKLASVKASINNRMIIQEMLHTPCIEKVMCVETEFSWMMSIVHYLKTIKLP